MNVVGIDPSLTRSGLVVLGMRLSTGHPQVLSEGVITPAAGYRPLRLRTVREGVQAVLRTWAPRLVAMEAEVWMASVAQGSDQAAVQAMLQDLLFDWLQHAPPGTRFLSINTSQVKKYVGATQKDQMLKEVYRRYDFDTPDHNIADAYTIARIGWDLMTGGSKSIRFTKPQEEVHAKLRASGFIWEPVPPPDPAAKPVRRKRVAAGAA